MPLNGWCRCEVRRTLPATLAAVERFFQELRGACRCVTEQPNGFTVELLAREALTNAVIHGCKGNPAALVRCTVRMRRNGAVIFVADSGEGFDWREASRRRAGDDACSGRGLQIYAEYATRLRFNSKGNGVAIWTRFGQAEE